MCDASNFEIGAAFSQSPKVSTKMNLISSNSRLFTQTELELFTLMRECTAIKYTMTDYEILILVSKHQTVLFTDHRPIIFLFTQKPNENHRIHRFQFIQRKFPNLHLVSETNFGLLKIFTIHMQQFEQKFYTAIA